MSFAWNSVPVQKKSSMVSGAYLRQQAEILIAMSRATFDLGVAGRLREMASELQTRRPSKRTNVGLPITRWRVSSARFGLGLSRSH